jgi:hypothetical protein
MLLHLQTGSPTCVRVFVVVVILFSRYQSGDVYLTIASLNQHSTSMTNNT